jgi:hypothetical protein
LRPGALQPAGHLHLAAAGVDAADHLAGEALAGLAHQVQPLHRGGAQDHVPHAQGQHLLDVRERAQPAAQLHLEARHGADGPHGVEVDRVAGLGAVEVDDVQAGGAGGAEGLGLLGRARRVDLLGGEVALLQADRLAAHEVDGGDDEHR